MRHIAMSTFLCLLRCSTNAYIPTSLRRPSSIPTTRLFASSNTAIAVSISRLETLQTLLSQHGAPGSQNCQTPNDLLPIALSDQPELVSALAPNEEFAKLHPYLYPVARSKSNNHYICAYRNPFVELDPAAQNNPWPLVETSPGGGMQVLALSSEHLMRRIVCECDFQKTNSELIDLYNEGLGQGRLADGGLDTPYSVGAVDKLGYGVDKYVLLRVGPFADLYQNMAEEHIAARGDEQSSLIAAETCNSKVSGFGSNFLYYSHLLANVIPNARPDEARDAARMCLRLPLATIGLSIPKALTDLAVLAGLVEDGSSEETAIRAVKELYFTMKQVEREDDPQSGKTQQQHAVEEANDVLNEAALNGEDWNGVRNKVAGKLREAHLDEMADFIDRHTAN